MITKIDIQKFGLFQDYQWKSNIGGDADTNIFKKMNIIYGRNYSGKTTLSRIFRCIELNQLHEKYADGQFVITSSDNSAITESNLMCNNYVRVYNSDFVKENLSWLHDNENGNIEPFTLLGSGNVEAEKRILEIENDLGSVENEKGLLFTLEQDKQKYSKHEKDLEKQKEALNSRLRDKANQEIKTNKYFVRQGKSYNIKDINDEIQEIVRRNTSYNLTDIEIAKHKQIIDESEKTVIEEITTNKPKLGEFISNVKSIVEKKITLSDTIQELVNDGLLQEWVNKGREYHRDKRQRCAFCGNIIDAERWRILDAHFSKESEELKKAIEMEKQGLENSISVIKNFLQSKNIIKDNYYAHYHNEFDEIYRQWEIATQNYTDSISKLVAKLQERYDDIFNPKIMENNITDCSDSILEVLALFNSLSIKNNEKTKNLEKDKEISRKALRYAEIEKFILTINYKKEQTQINENEKNLSIPKQAIDDLSKRIYDLQKEKKQQELKLNDEGEAAKKVNNHLFNFFGHDGLSLEPESVEGGKPQTKFVIKRGSQKAHSLSEGECSLISFCYFIAKMEDELSGSEREQLIIYIDDPISSLDNNHIFFMFSLIETVIAKDKRYGQLFISTHSLDFLKYIKRLTPSPDKSINHFIVEKRKKDKEYRCYLLEMPQYLKDYITEYNFLFKEIYNMAKPFTGGDRNKYFENNFSLFYNLPNNMRKFLECYLFYRYPNTEDPLKNLPKLFNGNVPALVNRVINEYSHLTWGDRGTLVTDIPEAESVSKEIIKALKKDREHFDALCESVKADKNIQLD